MGIGFLGIRYIFFYIFFRFFGVIIVEGGFFFCFLRDFCRWLGWFGFGEGEGFCVSKR